MSILDTATSPLGSYAIVLTLAGIGYGLYRLLTRSKTVAPATSVATSTGTASRTTVDPEVKYEAQGSLKGVSFGPIGWAAVGVLASTLCATILYILIGFAEVTWGVGIFGNFWVAALAVSMLSGTIFLLGIAKRFTVPTAHVAVMLILGMRTRIYLREGKYFWGEIPWVLEYSRQAKEGFTDINGFVGIDDRQIAIWDSSNKENPQKELNLIASDTSPVFATLLIVVRVYDPFAILGSDKPLLDLAERARSAIRTAVSYVNARDNVAIKSILGSLLGGQSIILAYITKTVGAYAEGSVVRDDGAPMYETLPANSSDEEVKKAKEKFELRLNEEANRDMLAAARTQAGKLNVQVRTVEQALDEVARAVGVLLLRASVGKARNSKAMEDAADRASTEGLAYLAQARSADAIAENAKKIGTSIKKEGRLAVLLAASKDDGGEGITFQEVNVVGEAPDIVKAGFLAGSNKGSKP